MEREGGGRKLKKKDRLRCVLPQGILTVYLLDISNLIVLYRKQKAMSRGK